jgi:ParB family chromosome partitioning protein
MVSLFGRKRVSELSGEVAAIAEGKKDELLALKLEEFNTDARQTGTLQMLPINLIYPDPTQPRKIFKSIDSLAASIREKGVIQPIIVRQKNAEGHYVIIAGERRYRAAISADLNTIPCIVRSETDANVLILQLLENDQRENVSPLEESEALSRLIEDMRLSKTEVAKELGRDMAWILHELRMFEEEEPEKARKLITRIRANTISGTYRQVISGARNAKKGKDPEDLIRTITEMDYLGDELVLHVTGRKRPVRYRLNSLALKKFLEAVAE